MVDEQRLIKLITERSGLNRQQVQDQMDELVKNIRTAEKTGNTFTIDGFGTFRQEEGATRFEPNEVLETEINQKYAGMKPIELMGSFKETKSGISEEITKKPTVPEKQKQPEPEIETVQTAPAAEHDEEPVPKHDSEPEPEATIEKKPEMDEETGIISNILVFAAIAVAILLTGWLFYNMGVYEAIAAKLSGNNNSITNNVKTNPRPQNNNLKTAGMDLNSVNQTNAGQIRDENLNEAEESFSLFGLKGPVQAKAKDGYTIVVHSLQRKLHAAAILEEIRQQGYRAMMTKAMVKGMAYWRLGIGQFQTIADAQKAAQTLPEPYASNHFIIHL